MREHDAGPSNSPRLRVSALENLTAAMEERWERQQAEAGPRWREVVRAALLRTASELWAVHVERTDQLQQQAPALFAFLPGAAAIPYAKEASNRYDEYRWLVKAETLSALLTLPQRYERPLPAGDAPVSSATAQLVGRVERKRRGGSRVLSDA